MIFHPLQKVEESNKNKVLPEKVYKLILERFIIVEEGIKRIEKSAKIKYPLYYIDPKIVIAYDSIESLNRYGIFFARTLPVISENYGLNIVIQISGALVAYGLKGTIHSIIAHEFLHYIDIVNKFRKLDVVSEESSCNLFEEIYKDSEKTIDPCVIFKEDPVLLEHIRRRFKDGFLDKKLEDKVIKNWITKGLPVIKDNLKNNFIRIPMEKIYGFKLDKITERRIIKYELDSKRSNRNSFIK